MSQNGLEKLCYNNEMPKYAKLMEILKAKGNRRIKFHYTKSKHIDFLVKRGLCLINTVKINK